VDDGAVLAVLRRADEADELPRLGGMARPNGVAIVSEERWAFAAVDGGERVLPVPASPRALARIPLLRGLVRLALALRPLFARGGSAGGKERLVLAAAVLAPLPATLLPHAWSLAAMLVASCALVGFMLRGRTLFLHGAEHRAIAAAEERSLVATWHGEVRPSRFSPRCGTNFAALVVPVTVLLDRTIVLPGVLASVVVPLLALTLTMELWQFLQAGGMGLVTRFCLAPGLLLQRVTTREPSLAETRVALRAVAAVLDASR
jgi:Protein of unknown function (DUF1385)